MSFIHYNRRLTVLGVVGGHPFDRNAFAAMFDSMDDVAISFVDQPAASELLGTDYARTCDALVFYDVPGIDLWRGVSEQRPDVFPAPSAVRDAFTALTAAGVGMVFLHHAIAGWPAWDGYANAIGGRFQYVSGVLNGRSIPDSGYVQNIAYTAHNLAPAHPVMRDVPDHFALTDELYLYEVNEPDVVQLLAADVAFTDDSFFSAEAAVARGRMYCNEGWSHPPGSRLIGWAKKAGRSPVVYLQPGDGAETYANPHFRRMVANSIDWVASDAARQWAATP